MPRRPSPTLTDGELRLMRVLWRAGPATVGEIVDGLAERPRPAYNTVLTMLRILERKQYVAHTRQGRAFVFRAVLQQHEARRSALKHLLDRLFEGSPRLLLLNLLDEETADAREIARLRRLLERHGTGKAAKR